MEATSIPVLGAVVGPASVRLVGLARGVGENFLHVPKSKIWVCLQHQGDDPGNGWCGVRGTRHLHVIAARITIAAEPIVCHSRVWRGDQNRRAWGAVRLERAKAA